MLVVAKSERTRLQNTITAKAADSKILCLNWLRGDVPELLELQSKSGLASHSEKDRIEQLQHYMASNDTLSDEWKQNAKTYLLT